MGGYKDCRILLVSGLTSVRTMIMIVIKSYQKHYFKGKTEGAGEKMFHFCITCCLFPSPYPS